MSNATALLASDNIFHRTVPRLVTHLIAFEAHLLGALVRVMCVLTAEDAGRLLRLIWALLGHVAELMAVVTFDRNIVLRPVAAMMMLFHQVDEVFILVLAVVTSHRLRLY